MIFDGKVFTGSREIPEFFRRAIAEERSPASPSPESSSTGKPARLLDSSSAQPDPISSAMASPNSEISIIQLIPALLAAALADAVNPCAFAVLIILLAGILSAGSRKRALLAGFAFSTAIFLSYLAMGFGLFQALASFKSAEVVSKIAGGLAILLGLFNLKDAVSYGAGGWKMEVPEAWRAAMKKVLARATSPAGAFLIGFAISLFLLPCTSGPYVVALGMLADKATCAEAAGCLVAYNFVFILPMLAITAAVAFGLDPRRVERVRKKHLRELHLIIGLLLVGIGAWAWLAG